MCERLDLKDVPKTQKSIAGDTIKPRIIFALMTLVFFVYSGYVWTHGTKAPQSVALTEQVKRGQHLYQQNNCTACHQFYGLGGYMGPDLTNVISEKGPAYAGAFLSNGTVMMPDFGFSQDEIDDLVGFLEFVDSMGTYRSPAYELTWYGTVAQLDEQ